MTMTAATARSYQQAAHPQQHCSPPLAGRQPTQPQSRAINSGLMRAGRRQRSLQTAPAAAVPAAAAALAAAVAATGAPAPAAAAALAQPLADVAAAIVDEAPAWTLDQAVGLVFGGLLLLLYVSSTQVDKFVAREQRKQLGLCEECGGLYEPSTCQQKGCPSRRQ